MHAVAARHLEAGVASSLPAPLPASARLAPPQPFEDLRFEQGHLDEVDWRVADLAADCRDGVRLAPEHEECVGARRCFDRVRDDIGGELHPMPVDVEGKVHFTSTLFSLVRVNLQIFMRSMEEMDPADQVINSITA